MLDFNTVYIMAYRQIKRFFRARSRVIGSILNPVMWLIFFGLGWSSLFKAPMAKIMFYGLDYMSYLAPGVLMMTIFMSSFIGGVTVIWDKEFGYLKEVLVAPVSRTASIIGRALGETLTAMLQGVAILIAVLLIAPLLNPLGAPLALAVGLLVALSFTSMGITIASRMKSMEGFHMLVNLIMLPLVFLSGAIYPIDNMPLWMKGIAYVNPLTYGVDLARWLLTGVSQMDPVFDLTLLLVLTAVMIAIASYAFNKATIE